jgi:hypothetical protein
VCILYFKIYVSGCLPVVAASLKTKAAFLYIWFVALCAVVTFAHAAVP